MGSEEHTQSRSDVQAKNFLIRHADLRWFLVRFYLHAIRHLCLSLPEESV